MSDKLTLKRGDRVKITSRRGTFVGTVLTAQNYGETSHAPQPDWYIELTDDERGYIYWKQFIDHGTVEKLADAIEPPPLTPEARAALLASLRPTLQPGLYDFATTDNIPVSHVLQLRAAVDTIRGRAPVKLEDWRTFYAAVEPILRGTE